MFKHQHYFVTVNTERVITMGEKTFNLTWNNHLANLSGLFEGLYKSGSLTDATLACQGGMLRAHRLVLAACSPYFERVFKEHYGEQPILILKGVPVEEMEYLLDFMYRGSIDVIEKHLPSLIKTATDLEIRGLSGDQRNQENSRSPYTRVEARMQRCHIEARVHTTEYMKEPSVIPLLPKQSSIDSLDDQIKVEEIEVEDDPMVIDEHEDTFGDPLQSPEAEIIRIPPPMYKRETRFKGQKRVSVGRSTRNNDVIEFRSKERIASKEESSMESYEDSSTTVKSEPNFNNTSADPMVPGIQMNDDLQERDESLESSKDVNETATLIIKKRVDSLAKKSGLNEGKEARRKSEKAQYKPFSCDLCTLAFTRASHLARHRRVHTGERPFGCSICTRMFARQDKLKQHLDSHLQWPKRKHGLSSSSYQSAPSAVVKGKRGRPRKVNSEQSAMEEILKFGEFSSLLNKSHSENETSKNEDFASAENERKMKKEYIAEEEDEDKDEDANRDKDNYGYQEIIRLQSDGNYRAFSINDSKQFKKILCAMVLDSRCSFFCKENLHSLN